MSLEATKEKRVPKNETLCLLMLNDLVNVLYSILTAHYSILVYDKHRISIREETIFFFNSNLISFHYQVKTTECSSHH